MKRELNKRVGEIEPIEGIAAVLLALKKANYMLGLVTSNNKNNVTAFLKKHQLSFFDIIYTGTSAFGKANVLEKLLTVYHIAKNEVVYIGDEIRDIEATKKLGYLLLSVRGDTMRKKD